MAETERTIDSVVKKGAPSWEAHELVLDGIPDERLEDDVTDERILNFAISGQLQPVLVRAKGTAFEVVEGRQRVKRALVINHLAGRHAYRGPLKSVKAAIERLIGTDIGQRIVEECPKGMKLLVVVHRGDDKEAQRAAVVANEHRDDDPLDRKIRKAKRMAKHGYGVQEIAADFGISLATAKRWLTVDPDKPKGKRGKNSKAPTRAKLASYHEKLEAGDEGNNVVISRWRVLFGWLAGKQSRAEVIAEFPELGKFIGGR